VCVCVCVRSRLTAAVAVAGLAFSVAGCSPKEPLRADEGAGNSAAPLNTNPKTTDFAVYAQNSATLQDRATVTGGDVGVRLAGSGPFLVSGYELALTFDASVDTAHNVMANRLLLQDRAHVGDIQVNRQDPPNGGSYAHKYPFPSSMPALPPLAPVSPGTAALTVNGTSTASPGSYGAVSISNAGVLRLKGGVYHFASLQIWNDAHIEALAPVQVRVAGRFSAADRARIIAANGVTLTAGDLRIEVSGKNGSSGSLTDSPKAATFGNDSIVHAVMLVPNGTLQTGQRAVMVGAYIARDVYMDIDAKVTYQSGVGPSGCLNSCDDGNPCTTDACSAGACTHALVAAGTSCADNNACNGGETCDGQGHCKAGTPITCPAPDQCHTTGTCNQTTGLCSNPAKADLTACDDGNPGSQGDVCTTGVCQGTIPCASAVDVHVGNAHTCAVRTDGSLWCWGLNEFGQLGNGTTDESSIPIRAGATTWNWAAVTTGALHSCGIRWDGTLWCWGDNGIGQLGNGTVGSASTPTQVAGQDWMLVQAGLTYTCGVQTNGSLWCWGANAHGALGNGTQSNSMVPVEVLGTNWVSVAAAARHTCGIKADQTLWCWGANADGALGNGGKVDSLTPVQVGGTTWYSVTVGGGLAGEHTCAVKLDGSLWCWGANSLGQLGTGSTTASLTPVRVGSATWTSVSAGIAYTCGVQGDGTLWCWGSNDNGQLGDGTLTNRLAPVRVPGQGWAQVAGRTSHTCGTRPDGSLWCWGNNADGEIGDGQTALRPTPEQVVGQLCSQVPICGNGQKEPGEECDDGNNTSGDGCTMDCQIEKCFGVECLATDQCLLSFCDPATGECLDPPKNDGTECDDGDLCTQKDTCQAGECTAGSPMECESRGACLQSGICDSSAGVCAYQPVDRVGCNIHLRLSGVADMGNGKHIAIFGYDSGATGSYHPTTNTLSPRSSTPPPAYLLPGPHIGVFLPAFDGLWISWTVDDETVTAAYDPQSALQPQTVGTGSQVVLPDGTTVMLTPDLTSYEATPPEPTLSPSGAVGEAFKGVLTGQLSIGPSGAAIYTLPISIPPGIAGMAPNLNLVYNSQGGVGIAGQGWELTGLSLIYRCPKTRVQDGYAQPVRLTTASVATADGDGVCLDGKRLFPGSDSFTTEMADFSTIKLSGDTFTVTTKTGETRYYGSTDSARVKLATPQVVGQPTIPNVSAMWALDKVVDPWGNYYTIEYNLGNKDFTTSGLIVTSIKYTEHQGSGGADQPPFYTVSFAYEARPNDVRHIRFSNSTVPKNQRLKTITTPRGTYTLNYKPDDDLMLPSRLGSIRYCSASDPAACLPDLAFDWDGGGYWWDPIGPTNSDLFAPPTHQYNIPEAGIVKGTQFVDLDGDGRPEYVDGRMPWGGENAVWYNTGSGWENRPDWKLPDGAYLAALGVVLGTIFADFDGDGLPDLITDNWMCTDATPDCTQYKNKPVVWLNRIKSGQGWSLAPGFSGDNIQNLFANMPKRPIADPDWLKLDLRKDKVVDMDGDGLADLVHFGSACCNGAEPICLYVTTGAHGLYVLRSTGAGWNADSSYTFTTTPTSCADEYILFDLNRDGLPDLRGLGNKINTGDATKGANGTVWQDNTVFSSPDPTKVLATADFDGDGLYDMVRFDPGQLLFATSTGYQDTPASRAYLDSLSKFAGIRPDYVDLNADGLADAVLAQGDFLQMFDYGELLVNTGSKWLEVDGFTSGMMDDLTDPGNWHSYIGTFYAGDRDPRHIIGHQVPVNPDGSRGTYLDLDGDGVNDCVRTDYKTAHLNKFRPPVIKGFPNGLAQNTSVEYAVISKADAQAAGTYADSGSPLDQGTRYFMLPLRVAASVSADNGVGGTSKTTYQYRDLRTSATQRGPQGFKQVIVSDPTGMVTTTTYSQAFPYTGMPTSVERKNSGLVTTTTTLYCDDAAAAGDITKCTPSTGATAGTRKTGIFVYPFSVTDTSYIRDTDAVPPDTNGPAIITTTAYIYDAYGNPTTTTVTTESTETGEEYQKTIANTYEGTDEQRLGKATKTVVTTRRLAPNANAADAVRTHTTEFKYRYNPALVLFRKKVEPDIVPTDDTWPIASQTVYDNDEYGNITTTMNCASDFDHCNLGEDNPAGDPNDPKHPPFRTTSVSYDPNDYDPTPPGTPGMGPRGELQYGNGRYPVRTTNALGQTESSAYDPLLGVLTERTGPNGIHTCYTYDAFGNQTEQTERCGASHPLTTTVARYLAIPGSSPAFSKVITVTTPPTSVSPVSVYTDALGRTIFTSTPHFSGAFTSVATKYNEFGQVHWTSRASFDGAYSTEMTYDWLGRISTVTQNLGSIDGGPNPTSSTVTTAYWGSKIQTHQKVNGVWRDRYEWKNVLGKVSQVQDQHYIWYTYDADGNLTKVSDPANNTVQIAYDVLGRKTSTQDPDLGARSYGYNGFGDLVSQTDTKAQTTTMAYDQLGRMTTKTDAAGTAEWVYDVEKTGTAWRGKLAAMISAPDPKLKGPCTIPNTTQTSGNRAGRSFTYDEFGQVTQVDECIDGETFSTNYQYDDFGRQGVVTYPAVDNSRLAVEYHYTKLGFLQYVADASDHKPYWVAKSMNAAGQVVDEQTRNGVETVSTRNPLTGWLMDATTTAVADNNTLVQKWTNTYDEVGNLLSRSRSQPTNIADSVETFDYDLLDRLTRSEVKIPSENYDFAEIYQYDMLGDLVRKGDKIYSYAGCGGHPHAVCQVGNTKYVYDGNGNMTNASLPEVGTGKLIKYNSANKVTSITNTPSVSNAATINTVAFIYGADANRVVQSVGTALDGETARTVYVGMGGTGKSLYERTTHGTAVDHVHFLYAGGAHGGNAFALRVQTTTIDPGSNGDNAPPVMRYQHFDHLGSVTASTDENGRVVGALGGAATTVLGYDAWGARRSPDGRPAATPLDLQPGHREFTGHETIPSLGLVNMNGRVYDPELGRFLSPDPSVQSAADLQSYNRYAYARNNPLRYTDPTGYFLGGVFDTIVNVAIGIATIAVCAGSEGIGCVAAFAALATIYNTTSMLASGVPFDQVMGAMFVGFVAGSFGGAAAESLGTSMAGRIVGGAIAGAISAGMATVAYHGGLSSLGQNIFLSASTGALSAALAWSLQPTNPVSQASADAQQGDGRYQGYGRGQLSSNDVNASEARALNADEADVVGGALTRQRGQIGSTLQGLERWNQGDQDVFEDVFVDSSPAARGHVTEVFDRMQSLSNSYSAENFRVDTGYDGLAYVDPANPDRIYLGERYFEAGENSQAGVLTHEMSHFNSIGATNDITLGGAGQLLKTLMLPSTDALGNAQSYAVYGACSTYGGMAQCMR